MLLKQVVHEVPLSHFVQFLGQELHFFSVPLRKEKSPQAVQVVASVHAVQLVPHEVQDFLSAAMIVPVPQVVHASAAVHAVQPAMEVPQAVQALPLSHVPAAQPVQVSAAEHVVQLVAQAVQAEPSAAIQNPSLQVRHLVGVVASQSLQFAGKVPVQAAEKAPATKLARTMAMMNLFIVRLSIGA